MNYNWLEHWEQNHLPFHLNSVNSLLEKYWPRLGILPGAPVLVPLCGKSQDLLYLAEQGLQVIGVELSQLACESFFIENDLAFNKQEICGFTRYYNNQIELFCGDFFTLPENMLPAITAVYDRAALVALPETLRLRYALQLTKLMTQDSQMLLIVYDSSDRVEGPPYSVSYLEITQLYGTHFKIKEQERIYKPSEELSQHLRDKGYNEMYKVIYSFKKQTTHTL
ncbi:MAG TPA: thiopurine S-methyltransferase [Gammaproteobacteria bacterium]|nr:thiopurine S-methyltransferase [Gammaproteobacteria bacterium]